MEFRSLRKTLTRLSTFYKYDTYMAESTLTEELKAKIIKVLNLEEMKPEDIKSDEPLFEEGLGLDSIDALELIVMLEKDYGIKVKNPAEGKNIFLSVNSMAEYIRNNRTK